MKPNNFRFATSFIALWSLVLASCSSAANTPDLSQLSPEARKLIAETIQAGQGPIELHCFVSAKAPPEYVAAIRNLHKLLAEVQDAGGGRLKVRIQEVDKPADVAAAEQFGIQPYAVPAEVSIVSQELPLFAHVVCVRGDHRAATRFLGPTVAVEHEFVRILRTVQNARSRKRLGIVRTQALDLLETAKDADAPEVRFLDTLRAFYDVVEIDPAQPDPPKVDVLLALQPSSIAPDVLNQFVRMVEDGTPTAIFEDPLPVAWAVLGTERHSQNFPSMQPPPKADLAKLWKVLGVEQARERTARGPGVLAPITVVWQKPDSDVAQILSDPHFVFARRRNTATAELHPTAAATRGATCLFFPIAGAIEQQAGAPTTIIPLVTTSKDSGLSELALNPDVARRGEVKPGQRLTTDGPRVLAVEVTGKRQHAAPAKRELHAIVVADLDCIAPVQLTDASRYFGRLGADNPVFLLNVLDALAGDTRWSAIRSRRLEFPPPAKADEQARQEQAQVVADCQQQESEAGNGFEAEFKTAVARIRNTGGDQPTMEQEMQLAIMDAQHRLQNKIRELREARDKKIAAITRHARSQSPSLQSTK